MSTQQRISLLDEAPIRPPVLATKLWGITAACTVIGFIPVTVLVFYLWSKIAPWLRASFGVNTDPPVLILAFISGMTCIFIPMAFGFRAASLYVLKLVKFYLNNSEPEKAEKVAEVFSEKVWKCHARRRPWFCQFVVEHGLNERIPRYSKL